ncbi:heavy metal translocating P-type ATPase [Shimia sp. R11_0]|uniref:heavy metal translocating P-type ATPase n=1 Tax=Shimia sp. R11_0 TaxID=2821096 RepID=UPI001ADB7553|nr:heavy metal translocating P-type ATPase [Shimia sp. R11_0]MBO9477598.1 heavy metal translocating P-type ATPase [Shimia sp. R11_0]
MQTLTFQIDGLNCAGCVSRAEKALAATDGVRNAHVNLADEMARVEAEALSVDKLVSALQAAGYPAREASVTMDVSGMSCAGCVRRAEAAMAAGQGVLEAAINFAAETATVRYLEGSVTPSQIAALSTKAGYPARLQQSGAPVVDRKADEAAKLRRDVLVAAVLAFPVFCVEMGGHLVPPFHHWLMGTFGVTQLHVMQFILTTLLLIGPGRQFYVKGFPALLKGAPEMNSLVAVGTSAAYLFSVVSTFAPQLLPVGAAHVYFEAAAVIVVLILAGRWMEARAKGRTGEAIRQLIGLQPRVARVERKGEITELSIEEVACGDVLHLRPGERVAVDGRVLDGQSYVDESMISGEPVPVLKTADAQVVAGTINGQGSLRYEAEKIGAETMLAQIIAMVREAQGTKLPIQARVDKITAIFVPAVMSVACLTFLVWLVLGPQPSFGPAVVAAVAVLIIACPCAMGLATPTSIMVGTGRAAQLGVLFRKGDALQSLRECQVVAFDKTGTLTKGAPALTDLQVTEGFYDAAVLAAVAAVEAHSEHPVARALVQAAQERGLTLPQASGFHAEIGMGAAATVAGQQVHVGATRYMVACDVAVAELAPQADRLAAAGKTPIFVAIDGVLAAVMAVADPVKDGAQAAVATLHDQGLKVAMISGDRAQTAQVLAKTLGVDHVVADVLPAGKVDALEALRAEFGAVAFVGDGINDAPALAAADVGIAIGTGTDVAIESADVVLMSGDVGGVVTAFDCSRQVIRNIGQNLFWAFGYNVALIPVAAGVLVPFGGPALSPMLGAGAMALSSVFVLSNALRLRRIQSPLWKKDV